MSLDMVTVLPLGVVEEPMVDRRTGDSWMVHVEPFELSETVVTCGLWDEVLGTSDDSKLATLPKTDVSWRDAIIFCNMLSVREDLTPVYEISHRESPTPKQWRPHSEPEVDDWMVVWNHDADGYRLPRMPNGKSRAAREPLAPDTDSWTTLLGTWTTLAGAFIRCD